MLTHAGRPAAEADTSSGRWNPYQFFLDPADTQVHRADLGEPLGDRAGRHPVIGGAGAGRPHPDGWSTFTFANMLRTGHAIAASAASWRLSPPQSHMVTGAGGGTRAMRRPSIAADHVAARTSARTSRRGGDAALRHACAARRALSDRSLDRRRDRRPAGGGGLK